MLLEPLLAFLNRAQCGFGSAQPMLGLAAIVSRTFTISRGSLAIGRSLLG
jgi:hypothetical protein